MCPFRLTCYGLIFKIYRDTSISLYMYQIALSAFMQVLHRIYLLHYLVHLSVLCLLPRSGIGSIAALQILIPAHLDIHSSRAL